MAISNNTEIEKKLWEAADELCANQRTRDLLLPRLVSGEVDVSGMGVEEKRLGGTYGD